MVGGVSLTADGKVMAFSQASSTALPELYASPTDSWSPRQLTAASDQIAGWNLASREVINWTSQDAR